MQKLIWATGASALALTMGLALGAGDAASQATPAATVHYEMDVGTASGMGLGAFGGGGGGVNLGALLSGRANEPRKELYLRLGSPQATPPNPAAQHFMPAGARLGASVPLVTPTRAPDSERETIPGQENGERPQGRILLFWGCGAHAPAGQPVVIDLARLTAGQVPPGLFSTSIPRDRSVSFANSRTYGDWPNGRSNAQVSAQSSLIGAHRVAGNYSPDIAFTLSQDFMPALSARSAANADGSMNLSWNAIAEATGYYAWTMGFRSNGRGSGGDIVWWTSSASQQFGGGLWDWMSPATVANLVRQRVVMPPATTSCTVPAEVRAAAPDAMFGNLYAYGPEADFAYPPRPANARTPWRPIWTARVRYRANTSWMVGGPGDSAENANGGNQPAQPNCRRRRGGLGGILGGVLGGGNGC